jgi:serine/threonine protein kinase
MSVNFDRLWGEARIATSEAESVRTLAKILSSKDGRKFISNLELADAELCIEILDHVRMIPYRPHPTVFHQSYIQALVEHKLHASEKQAFFGTLRRLAGKHARLPNSVVIKGEIDFSDPTQPQTSGGFADIKPGKYKGCTVAVKTLRVSMADDLDKIRKVSKEFVFAVSDDTDSDPQQFCKEVIIWNSLSHPNILRLTGVMDGFDGHLFAAVSEWMVHGNIMEYINKNATNRLGLVRVSSFQVIPSLTVLGR